MVYTSYLGAMFRSTLPGHPVWSSESKVSQLAASMVQLYEQMRQSFSADSQGGNSIDLGHFSGRFLGHFWGRFWANF